VEYTTLSRCPRNSGQINHFNCLIVAFVICLFAGSLPALATTPFVHEAVDTTGDVGSYPSLALDAQGDPHISYLDVSNYDLKYAVKTGGSWTIETVDATGNVGRYTSIRLDAQGNPHISYFDDTDLSGVLRTLS
jgi:hypothetical protein